MKEERGPDPSAVAGGEDPHEALRRSVERYRDAMAAAEEGLWEWDLATGEGFASDAWYALFGYSPLDVPAHFELWRRCVHPDDAPAIEAALGDYLEGRAPSYRVLYRVVTRTGELRWHQGSGKIVARDAAGKPLRMVGTNRDVTEQVLTEQRLREANARLALAVEAADIGIWAWSYVDDSLFWDERLCRWYQVPDEVRDAGLTYEFWRARVHPDDREGAEARLAAARRKPEPFVDEFRLLLPDGTIRYIYSACIPQPGPGGEPIGVVGINRDITAQRELEERLARSEATLRAANEQLERHRDDLEALVHERTRELAATRDDVESADRAKLAFLRSVSHELRTPMNHIMGMAQILSVEVGGDRARQRLAHIDRASRELLRTINDVLEFTQLESRRITMEVVDFDLDALLARAVGVARGPAEDKGLLLVLEQEPALPRSLKGDPTRLGQILDGLLANAVKFSDAGVIRLHIGIAAQHKDAVTLRFEVEDQGIGMSPAVRAGLFQVFRQGDQSLSRRHRGTGLGLALCKRLVSLMGGEIGADSVEGRGSTFWFTLRLPLGEAPPPSAEVGCGR